jgi:hypothetical protein
MRSNSSSLATSFRRWAKLLIGFVCFGFSIAFLKQANLGLGPWDVLSDGLAGLTGMQLGTVSIIIGVALLLLWIPIREKPGLATVLNVLLVGVFANMTLALVRSPSGTFLRSVWFVTSDFSVQPLRSLCLCGCFFEQFLNHRGTENAEVAQRRRPISAFCKKALVAK